MLRLVTLKKVVDTDAVLTIKGYLEEDLAQMNRVLTIRDRNGEVAEYTVISINDYLTNEVLDVLELPVAKTESTLTAKTESAPAPVKKARTKKEA